MKTRTLPPYLIPIVGLLVLAGVFSNAPPAIADCPPPPGVISPVAPSVTAQQVEDGSGYPEGLHAGREGTICYAAPDG